MIEWDRGFPAAVVHEFDALGAVWPRLAFRTPIVKLHLFELSVDQAEEFATWPGLACLREMSFSLVDGEEHNDVLVLLADCPGLARLETLNVNNASLGRMASLALLDSPHFVGLKALSTSPGWVRGSLPAELEARLIDRFGPDVLYDAIPF
ncbi:MAG: hypothetical protein K2V38_25830 [Gemmataceae bacterium]|nr:hypothetical protein [Gemmataceae bacterium]